MGTGYGRKPVEFSGWDQAQQGAAEQAAGKR